MRTPRIGNASGRRAAGAGRGTASSAVVGAHNAGTGRARAAPATPVTVPARGVPARLGPCMDACPEAAREELAQVRRVHARPRAVNSNELRRGRPARRSRRRRRWRRVRFLRRHRPPLRRRRRRRCHWTKSRHFYGTRRSLDDGPNELDRHLQAVDGCSRKHPNSQLPRRLRTELQAVRAERARLGAGGNGSGAAPSRAKAWSTSAEALARATADAPPSYRSCLTSGGTGRHSRSCARWKELDRTGAAAGQLLWQRFDAALTMAYGPVGATWRRPRPRGPRTWPRAGAARDAGRHIDRRGHATRYLAGAAAGVSRSRGASSAGRSSTTRPWRLSVASLRERRSRRLLPSGAAGRGARWWRSEREALVERAPKPWQRRRTRATTDGDAW